MLSIDVQVPTSALLGASNDVEEAQRAGLARVATHVQQVAVRKVGDIRKRRVPTKLEVARYNQSRRVTKSGRKRALRAGSDPAWEPTGELQRSVEAAPEWEKREAVELHADVPHAEPRHELGVSRQPKAPALGIIRRDPFFAETVEVTAGQIGDLFVDGFSSRMEAT